MISVPADIAGQSKHAADWLDGRKEQGPSPVLARGKRQLEELEVDWADAFAVPETESVTVPRPKKKRTEKPAATSHLPPAISASHNAKRSSCLAARCSPPKAKRMRVWTRGSRGGRRTRRMKCGPLP